LIQFAISFAKNEQQKTIELQVNRHNKAKDFYTKIGFTIKEEKDFDIGNGYFMNDYVMEYLL
jgi:ribosomal protein S18 acetylase RimI-like enzyme